MAGVRDILSQFDDSFANTPAADRSSTLTEGRYQFRVVLPKSGAVVSQDKDNAIRARIALEVVVGPSPDSAGKKTSKSWTLVDKNGQPNEQSVGFLKADLKVLGAECVKMSDVANALMSVIGAIVDSTVVIKEKDGRKNENIYFNALAKPVDPAAAKTGF